MNKYTHDYEKKRGGGEERREEKRRKRGDSVSKSSVYH